MSTATAVESTPRAISRRLRLAGRISQGEAARILGVYPTTVVNLAKQGLLSERRIPGSHPTYDPAEVLRRAEEWTTKPETASAE